MSPGWLAHYGQPPRDGMPSSLAIARPVLPCALSGHIIAVGVNLHRTAQLDPTRLRSVQARPDRAFCATRQFRCSRMPGYPTPSFISTCSRRQDASGTPGTPFPAPHVENRSRPLGISICKSTPYMRIRCALRTLLLTLLVVLAFAGAGNAADEYSIRSNNGDEISLSWTMVTYWRLLPLIASTPCSGCRSTMLLSSTTDLTPQSSIPTAAKTFQQHFYTDNPPLLVVEKASSLRGDGAFFLCPKVALSAIRTFAKAS